MLCEFSRACGLPQPRRGMVWVMIIPRTRACVAAYDMVDTTMVEPYPSLGWGISDTVRRSSPTQPVPIILMRTSASKP